MMIDRKQHQQFEKLYRNHVNSLFRFVLFRLSNKEEAIDIVEEAFVRLWREMSEERQSELRIREPRALLYTIARNLVIDWYRKEKPVLVNTFIDTEEGEELALEMFASNDIGMEVMAEAKFIQEKMKQLEPLYREVMYLRFVEDLKPQEIAKILNKSPNVISVRIARGLEQLKTLLHTNK